MIVVNYAVQTFDGGDRKTDCKRYASNDKKEITIKCITSLLDSIDYMFEAIKLYDTAAPTSHNVYIFDDHSSTDTLNKLHILAKHYSKKDFNITIVNLNETGYINSMKRCWSWLANEPGTLVYQVPDDYLFSKTAIYEMIDMFFQLKIDTGVSPFVIPFHHSLFHRNDTFFKYKKEPRMLIGGKLRYWTNTFNIYSTFMTDKPEFLKHTKAYEIFLSKDAQDPHIDDVLNDLVKVQGVWAVVPVDSIALHLDDSNHKEPYVDWKKLWDSIPKIV